jgi:hypothetical protein
MRLLISGNGAESAGVVCAKCGAPLSGSLAICKGVGLDPGISSSRTWGRGGVIFQKLGVDNSEMLNQSIRIR